MRTVKGVEVKSLAEFLGSVEHGEDLNGELYGMIQEEDRRGFQFQISWGYPDGAELGSDEVAVIDEYEAAGSYGQYLRFMGVKGIL